MSAHDQLRRLIEQALDLATTAEREQLLAACSDPQLAAEARSLLGGTLAARSSPFQSNKQTTMAKGAAVLCGSPMPNESGAIGATPAAPGGHRALA